jgi:hypothetical protein
VPATALARCRARLNTEMASAASRGLPGHELAFLIEVVPHVVELLDDGIDALLELRTRQIVVDLLHLGLLSLLDQPRVGHRDERLPQRYGDGKGAERRYESVMSFTFDCRKTIEIAHQCCWRTRHDSNVWPLPSEGSALSS